MSDTSVRPPVAGASRVVTAREIAEAYRALAGQLRAYFDDGPCTLLGILLGGLFPLVRISECLAGDYLLDTCRVSRYGNATSGGAVSWVSAPTSDLRDRTILLVDDIFDEGVTLDFVARHCHDSGAARVVTVALIRKQHARHRAAAPDHAGIEVADRYVFGAGMDYRGHWRHLPDIWALPSVPS
jgi:hypoxanthine phosphoribosyltransferase